MSQIPDTCKNCERRRRDGVMTGSVCVCAALTDDTRAPGLADEAVPGAIVVESFLPEDATAETPLWVSKCASGEWAPPPRGSN